MEVPKPSKVAGWSTEGSVFTLTDFLEDWVWSLLCIREWRVSSSDLEKRFSQEGKVHGKGFSPVCVRICRVWRWGMIVKLGTDACQQNIPGVLDERKPYHSRGRDTCRVLERPYLGGGEHQP